MNHRAFAASALLCCLVAAGCSGDPEPKIADPSPSPSASLTASPSTTATEAADPEQAHRDFIGTYVAAISDSLSTGDPSVWLAMSDPDCENCRNLAEGLADAYRDGGRIEGGSWSLTEAAFDEAGTLGDVYNATIVQSEEQWLDSAGTLVKTVPATTSRVGFAIQPTGDAFVVRELDLLGS